MMGEGLFGGRGRARGGRAVGAPPPPRSSERPARPVTLSGIVQVTVMEPPVIVACVTFPASGARAEAALAGGNWINLPASAVAAARFTSLSRSCQYVARSVVAGRLPAKFTP